jgi:glycosyltransferase 2 family protein
VHFIYLVIAVVLSGRQKLHVSLIPSHPTLPPYWVLIAAVLVAFAIATAIYFRSHLRNIAYPALKTALTSMREAMHKPKNAVLLFGGSIAITTGYILALQFSVWAFDATVSPLIVATIYLSSSAFAGVAPTPGGLGALEAALFVGLNAAGMHADIALAAVLLYRLTTFWFLMIPGAYAYVALRRRSIL